jgi:hypothetical protein
MTTDKPKPRRQRRPTHPDVRIEPVLVSHEIAAAMLGQIGLRTLDAIVASGKLKGRRLGPGRVVYLRRDIEALAESLPIITPGAPAPRADPPAE